MVTQARLEDLPSAFSVKEALLSGIPRERLRNRLFKRPFHGVCARQDASLIDRLRGLCRQIPSHAFLSGQTAAALWELPLPSSAGRTAPLAQPFVAVKRGLSRVRRKWVRTSQLTVATGDVTRWKGMRITTPKRTWLDLSRTLPPPDFLALTDALLRNPELKLTRRKLSRYAARHAGTAGARLRKQALAWADPNSESPMESILRWHLLAQGGPRPECNTTLRLPDGSIFRPDLLFRSAAVIAEYNGAHHNDADVREYDEARKHKLEAAGFRVVVLDARDIPHFPRRSRAILDEIQRPPPHQLHPAVMFREGKL